MDSDNVKNLSEKNFALENVKNADVIIGTKMITTGFDFRNI
jgi:primosomal protein N'